MTTDIAALDERLRKIMGALIWNDKATGLVTIWMRDLAPTFKWSDERPTAWVDTRGVSFNPKFAATLSDSDLAFILMHEVGHVAFDSMQDAMTVGALAGTPRSKLLNICQDAVLNKAFVDDAIVSTGVPKGGVTFDLFDRLANERGVPVYPGDRTDSIGLFEWALKILPPEMMKPPPQGGAGQPQQPQQGAGQQAEGGGQSQKPGGQKQKKSPGGSGGSGALEALKDLLGQEHAQAAGGCSPNNRPEGVTQETVERMKCTLREAGRGSALARALTPRPGRVSWRDALRLAMTQAATDASARTTPTYSRAGRRLGMFPGIILAGRAGAEPKLTVCIDTSGSMGPDAVEAIMGECLKLQSEFPGARVYLTAHTDRLTWSGWLKRGGDKASLVEATKYSGGTDCNEAWESTRGQGRFDAMVHFTDGFISWPAECPVRGERFTLALLGQHATDPQAYSAGPQGAKKLGVTQVTL